MSRNSLCEKALLLHLHRYLSLTLNIEYPLSNVTKNFLNEIYSEISYYDLNYEFKLSENTYSLAFYRCLCMIDLYRTTYSDPWALLEILENYSLIFRDKYIFCMLQIVVSLTSGKYLYSILNPKI